MVGRIRPSDNVSVGRGHNDRRRRRLDSVAGSRRIAAQRTAECRRRSRARLLRQGRDGSHQHGREPVAWQARRGASRRSPRARSPTSVRGCPRYGWRSAGICKRLQAAHAIVRVANANMANATKLISVGRGFDPRDFALVVFGGAGPLHGCDLARELDIPVVIFPRHPGIASAMGCLLVDIRHDLSRMCLFPAEQASTPRIEALFADLEAEARDTPCRRRSSGRRDAPAPHDRHALCGPVAAALHRDAAGARGGNGARALSC